LNLQISSMNPQLLKQHLKPMQSQVKANQIRWRLLCSKLESKTQ
jgi:hypothetical protein